MKHGRGLLDTELQTLSKDVGSSGAAFGSSMTWTCGNLLQLSTPVLHVQAAAARLLRMAVTRAAMQERMCQAGQAASQCTAFQDRGRK